VFRKEGITMLLDESYYETIKKAERETGINYTEDIYWKDKDDYNGYIDGKVLYSMVEDLLYELSEKEDYIRYLQEDEDPNTNDYEEKLIREAEERGEL
jgi:hypothetical protein